MRLYSLQLHALVIFVAFSLFIRNVQVRQNTKDHEPVKIGLLIPDNKSNAARQGAEMAILKANASQGFNGRPFQLIVRSMEGLWGTGSKEAVNLIFEEDVWAIVGSHDGRNAHIVEQVATKARIVFLSAWASDPTLSQAFVPWYFSCVPNDIQQADALINEIYNKRKYNNVAALSDSSYDSKLAIKSFVKKTKSEGKKDPSQFFYDNTSHDFTDLLNDINKLKADCIILFGQPSTSMRLIQQIKAKKIDQPVFCSLATQDENQLSDQEFKNYENVFFVSSVQWSGSTGIDFRKEYRIKYGNTPGPVAAYAYDGMSLLIEAIRIAGLDREKIQKSIKETKFEGVTGLIQFDDKGNRLGTPGLIQIINGIPVPVGRD
jgi:branched-chain amino acid transport system substrate-binding protein